ncbi:tumor necrosis factor ligand superfamily member 14 [Xenentodon cancila]
MFFSFQKNPAGMNKGGPPAVYVVDSHTTRPPLPPRLNQRRSSPGATQTILVLLVSLALCGMVIEAFFIYHLYQSESKTSGTFSKFIAGDLIIPTKQPFGGVLPSKPVAHLTDGQDVVHEKDTMKWSMNADPILHQIGYSNGSLIIQKEGYYYIYSKVFFLDSGVFYHLVNLHTEMYDGESITLLQARKYSPPSSRTRSNSFLAGVFHLFKNDAIYVNVSNTLHVMRHKSFENVFGAYMI